MWHELAPSYKSDGKVTSEGRYGSYWTCLALVSTNKAMVERNGVWKGVDVPHDISAPIVGEIQQTWADDFPRIG